MGCYRAPSAELKSFGDAWWKCWSRFAVCMLIAALAWLVGSHWLEASWAWMFVPVIMAWAAVCIRGAAYDYDYEHLEFLYVKFYARCWKLRQRLSEKRVAVKPVREARPVHAPASREMAATA